MVDQPGMPPATSQVAVVTGQPEANSVSAPPGAPPFGQWGQEKHHGRRTLFCGLVLSVICMCPLVLFCPQDKRAVSHQYCVPRVVVQSMYNELRRSQHLFEKAVCTRVLFSLFSIRCSCHFLASAIAWYTCTFFRVECMFSVQRDVSAGVTQEGGKHRGFPCLLALPVYVHKGSTSPRDNDTEKKSIDAFLVPHRPLQQLLSRPGLSALLFISRDAHERSFTKFDRGRALCREVGGGIGRPSQSFM